MKNEKNKLTFWILLLVLFGAQIQAQEVVGFVKDNSTGKPLTNASVYINNTTIGTVTNDKGVFTLTRRPGRFEIVASFIGYETQLFSYTESGPDTIMIALTPKTDELSSVTIYNFDKDGWQHYGELFRNTFLGSSPIGDKCVIKNHKDLRFSYSIDDDVLRVYAVNPIIIINNYLGYRIEYDLVRYLRDGRNRSLQYKGYVKFEELKANDKKKRVFASRRKEVYQGSLLHFMRSIYNNQTEVSGFEVKSIRRTKNVEKERIKLIWQNNQADIKSLPQDSVDYYKRILKQGDAADVLFTIPPKYEDLIAVLNANEKVLHFPGLLYVAFPGKKAAPAYIAERRDPGGIVSSQIALENSIEGVTIFPDGSYFDPENLIAEGYWAWSEKVGWMLPLDFQL
jgi:hypothetical protein